MKQVPLRSALPPGSAAAEAAAGGPWHTQRVPAVLRRLDTSERGLTTAEAARRLSAHGPNELGAARPVPVWRLLLAQFRNVLILVLVAAAGLSALLGRTLESVVILIILLFAAGLGFAQEYRAERAMEGLRRMAAPIATTRRDAREAAVAARDLVPGDVVLLEAGARVPADGRVLQAVNLELDEAPLTGESAAVAKTREPLADAGLPVADRTNMVYAGTTVSRGRGTAVVVATGMATEFGAIARLLGDTESRATPLQQNLDRMGRALARAALAVVAVVVGLGLLRGQSFWDMVLFGVALAVAVVPEALPAVVTISLALGAQRMVRRHALVRRLSAVETLGSVSVIASDKTGTLTTGQMTVRRVFAGGSLVDMEACDPASPAMLAVLRAAALASDARPGMGDPTEVALVSAAARAGLVKEELEARFPRVAEIPFTSETKRMTTLHRAPDGVVAFSKGAPEVVLAGCKRVLDADGERGLRPGERQQLLLTARGMAAQALRVLAVAVKQPARLEDAQEGMTLLGLVGMSDPPRPESARAIATCRRAGIKPILITGDHALTAAAVARELGILEQGLLVTGAELDAMSDEELRRRIGEIEVYARVSPAHKLRVVTAWQEAGRYVAMTGDGVNDAPALKKADIGVAMGKTGTDVTRDAAAMTLTDDNFASIVAAVEEGRGVFSNVRKYLMYLLSANIGEIGLMAGAAVLGLPLPLTAVQILYVNLATDGLPALALAVDPPEADLMRRPPRDPRTGIFTRSMLRLTLLGGAWSTAVNLGVFAWALHSGRGYAEAVTMVFVSLVCMEFFKAYNYRSDRRSVLIRPFANTWLNLAVAWELALLGAVVYVPFLSRPFGTFGLTLEDWLVVAGAAASISPVLELAKWLKRAYAAPGTRRT
jgi:Ca2+-transporting ATPase